MSGREDRMTNTHRRRTLRGALVAALLTAVATPALAACPAKAPKMKWKEKRR